MDFVHVRARPQARLDAVARGAVDGDGEGVLVHGLRLQGFEHIFIACIAARADHCARLLAFSRRVLRRLRPLPRRFHPGQSLIIGVLKRNSTPLDSA